MTADLHLAENPRDAYRFAFLERTLPAMVQEYGVRRVLVLGDLTEVKDAHRAPLVNRIVDGAAALAEEADVYFLRGNHDSVAADVPFYRFMRHLNRVRWINEPTAVALRGLGDCLLLPHTRDLGDWADLMLDAHDWFFCHQTFGGADLGHGYRVEGGPAPFARNSRVVSGDVHVPQEVGPVTYVGAPYTVDFGDDFEPRVLLLDGDRMRSVPVPGPQKRLVVVRDLDRLGSGDPGAQTGDVVKVRVEVGGGDLDALGRPHIRKLVHEWADSAGVELYAVEIALPEGARESRAAARERPTRSDEELVRAYAKKMGKGRAAVAAGLKIVEETP